MNRFIPALFYLLALLPGFAAPDRNTRPLAWDLEANDAYRADPLVQLGYLPVTLFGADPTGKNDSTDAIQQCMDAAFAGHMACYFPSGTYLVSRQVRGLQSMHKMTDVSVLIGGSKNGRRPIIKLADRTFTGQPTAVVLLQTRTAEGKENVAAAYNMVFRGIDLDLGEGNSGAIGVHVHGAQGCAVQDTRITGRGFFAGVKHLAGSGAVYGNIEVDGGDYGIDASDDSAKDPVVAGLVLKNQRVAAFLFDPFTALTVVGFRFESQRGPLFTLKRQQNNCNAHLGLIDGTIEVADSMQPVIHNVDRSIFLKDVYVRNARVIVRNDQGESLLGTEGGWTKVNEYSFFHEAKSRALDGKVGGSELVVRDVVASYSGSVPVDSVRRHTWDEAAMPGPEDSGRFVNVADFGADRRFGADASSAIQKAIDEAAREDKAVLLPKGEYKLSKTLRLHANTRMFGVSRNLSVLRADDDWRSKTDVPMLATPDDPAGRTALAFFKINPPLHYTNGVYSLNWRVGRGSIVREVWFEKSPQSTEPKVSKEIRISGSGGGRWYGLFTRRGGPASRIDGFRYLTVEGTTEPLHIYAYCPEYSQSDCQVEFNRVQNVFVYGLKAETDLKREHNAPVLWIRDSSNILICGYTGIAEADAGRGLIELKGSTTDIVLANMGRWRPSAAPEDSWYYVFDESNRVGIKNAFAAKPSEKERNIVSIFKKGSVTLKY